jgi:hypothetical protein
MSGSTDEGAASSKAGPWLLLNLQQQQQQQAAAAAAATKHPFFEMRMFCLWEQQPQQC